MEISQEDLDNAQFIASQVFEKVYDKTVSECERLIPELPSRIRPHITYGSWIDCGQTIAQVMCLKENIDPSLCIDAWKKEIESNIQPKSGAGDRYYRPIPPDYTEERMKRIEWEHQQRGYRPF